MKLFSTLAPVAIIAGVLLGMAAIPHCNSKWPSSIGLRVTTL